MLYEPDIFFDYQRKPDQRVLIQLFQVLISVVSKHQDKALYSKKST